MAQKKRQRIYDLEPTKDTEQLAAKRITFNQYLASKRWITPLKLIVVTLAAAGFGTGIAFIILRFA